MTAELHELRRARKRRAIPIPASACQIFGVLGIRHDQYQQTKFRLSRRRAGVTIWFVRGRFSWNVSHLEKVRPANFKIARQWVAAYASRFGEVLEEIIKPRTPIAVGADRKLLKAGGCHEAWLESSIPELWAEACMRCQHPGGFCSQDGFCHYGNCNMVMKPRPPAPPEEDEDLHVEA